MNNELNHLENYEEFSGLVHEKGSSPVKLTTNQFLEKLKIENPEWIFTQAEHSLGAPIRTNGYPTFSDVVQFSMSKASKYVEVYKDLYGRNYSFV